MYSAFTEYEVLCWGPYLTFICVYVCIYIYIFFFFFHFYWKTDSLEEQEEKGEKQRVGMVNPGMSGEEGRKSVIC